MRVETKGGQTWTSDSTYDSGLTNSGSIDVLYSTQDTKIALDVKGALYRVRNGYWRYIGMDCSACICFGSMAWLEV